MKRLKTWTTPKDYASKLKVLEKRILINDTIRSFFKHQGFLEVETPILQVSPGMEPHLKAFKTTLDEPFMQSQSEMYLHTSPEFAMKKLLVAGLPKIFQLARVFRNEERSIHHHPEFVMLEWYRLNADYTAIMEDTIGLFRECAKAVGVEVIGGCHLFKEWERLSVFEAFKRYAGIDLEKTLPKDPTFDPDPSLLKKEAEKIGIQCPESDRFDDIFFRIAFEKIDSRLGEHIPTILYDYPLCMAALSRRKPSDPRLAERFEVYISGVELANAFSELTDATEQRRRFMLDMDLKQKLYNERYPIDEEFLEALAFGLPECSGIAVGVDRLVMMLTGVSEITDVLWLPVGTAVRAGFVE